MARRRIMHIDMDAFFASVEQLDNPALRGLPVIVGGSRSDENRGVVSAASYEARAFGVRSAMPVAEARRRCPEGVFVPTRGSRYAELSRCVMAALRDFSPVLEQASVDEAYLDVTGCERIFGPPREMALAVKRAVRTATGGLTCSAGIAPVKFLAKIASDQMKPDGYFILEDEDVPAFLSSLPVRKIPGVGKKSEPKLAALRVTTCADVLAYGPEFWERRFGIWGRVLHERAQGVDTREVVTHHEPKSESAENTFHDSTMDLEVLETWLLAQAERVGASLRKHENAGRTVTVKLKYATFIQKTRSKTLETPIDDTTSIYETARELLRQEPLKGPLRLIGVAVSGFGAAERQGPEQLSLLELPAETGQNQCTQAEAATTTRRRELDTALDAVRERFGKAAIQRGKLFFNEPKHD